jgi:hypothetical protein
MDLKDISDEGVSGQDKIGLISYLCYDPEEPA